MQKNLTILFTFAIFVLVLGWAITFTSALAKGRPEPKTKGTPLCVTFRDDDGDRVTSNDMSVINPYCNHVGSTGLVTLSPNGDFIFASTGGKEATRRFGLDFTDACVDSEEDLDDDGTLDCTARELDFGPVVDPADLAWFNINSDSHIDLTDIDDFPVGTDPMKWRTVGLNIRFTLEGDEKITRTINFDPKNESWACPAGPDNGDQVTVMRPTEGCWMLFSLATQEGCLTASNSHAGGSGKKTVSVEPQGRYHMPFLMTLQKIEADGTPAWCGP